MAYVLLPLRCMSKEIRIENDRIELRSGGGWPAIFGVPFMVAGVFMALAAIGVVPLQIQGEAPWWLPLVMLLTGIGFFIVGSHIVFGREWITIDPRRGEVRRSSGWLVPSRSERALLHEFDAVVLSHDEGDSDTAETFPVTLQPVASRDPFKLRADHYYEKSRALAEAVARLLSFPLKDATSDHEVVTAPDEFGQTYGTRAAQKRAEDVDAPPKSRVRVERTGDATTIFIPVTKSTVGGAIEIAIAVGLCCWLVVSMLPFFDQTETPRWVQAWIVGFVVLLFGAVVVTSAAGLARKRRSREVIRATRGGIVIEQRSLVRNKRTEISAEAILDLDYNTHGLSEEPGPRNPYRHGLMWDFAYWLKEKAKDLPSKGIVVKTRSALHVFAAGLRNDEVRYIHSVLRQALVG